ncbi:hypothetical protein N7492_008170 [Penicillium capsulatum]|uniref:Uncharacterized protein n=1 Tax=Penicillium capsulatum TaxID=69766 RepID=A0A9W9LGT8_9EURO|nr:hypothetical protein N7492_008170 [Penicillium capsulatum]
MFFGKADPSQAIYRSRRLDQSSESSSSSKAATFIWNPQASKPQSPTSSLLSSSPESVNLVRQIPAALFSTLVQNPEVPKEVRSSISPHNHSILYKITPGEYHEKIIWRFGKCLDRALENMGLSDDDFFFAGTGCKKGHSSETEPGTSFYPGTEPAPGAPWPWSSLVLEVGTSESVAQLYNDAQWWFANSGHQTKIVVLVSATPVTHDADVEIWMEVTSTRVGATTRAQDAHALERTKMASIRNGVMSGDTLVIDFEALMRRPARATHEKRMCK